jgi:hypothetical protein
VTAVRRAAVHVAASRAAAADERRGCTGAAKNRERRSRYASAGARLTRESGLARCDAAQNCLPKGGMGRRKSVITAALLETYRLRILCQNSEFSELVNQSRSTSVGSLAAARWAGNR